MCKDTPTLPLLQILMDIKTKKANLVAIPYCFDSLFALRKPQKQLHRRNIDKNYYYPLKVESDKTICFEN